MINKEFSLALALLGWKQVKKNKWIYDTDKVVLLTWTPGASFCFFIDYGHIPCKWVSFNTLEDFIEYIQNE